MSEAKQQEDLLAAAQTFGVEAEDLVGGVNLPQAARLLGLAASTLRARALAGEIGHVRYGRSWRFLARHLVEFLRRHEHAAVNDSARRSKHQIEHNQRVGSGPDDAEVEAHAREFGLI